MLHGKNYQSQPMFHRGIQKIEAARFFTNHGVHFSAAGPVLCRLLSEGELCLACFCLQTSQLWTALHDVRLLNK